MSEGKKLIAVVLVRGLQHITSEIKDTLFMLRLRKKLTCVVLDDTPTNRGMIKKVKDYITWGAIDQDTLKLLVEKRGKVNPEDKTKTKPYFNLHPPRGGFERKGTKKPFAMGGALGDRKEKINDLLKKMI